MINIEEQGYKRAHGTEVLGVYSGKNEQLQPSMYVKLKRKPHIKIKSNLLQTNIFIRKDHLWVLEVSLLDNKFLGVFEILINDLINSVKKSEFQEVAERKLIFRYNEWQKLFDEKSLEILSFKKILGLIGELYFLKNVIFEKKGVINGLLAWIGPSGADKDFVFENTWFEVKSKLTNKNEIFISNQNQLESEIDGYLVVASFEKTSELNEESVNLIKLTQQIEEVIPEKHLKKKFNEKLIGIGFITNELYEDFNFKMLSIDYYKVDDKFPKLYSSMDNNSIINISYEIYLPNLNTNKVKGIWNDKV
ncbi:PD-(D/E)XK motif protein [Staphylococcus lentus]|uniref:PD-(D/E)XK motif protein n=1 Tax=Mammaliicoccus lentus TaxID=42858 RepID=UPI001884478A|nr:PD-(D/E)XK motif protein [Mammaliicoccus lentus]MBF0841006.1 PD-(D/E)XK motif protein [Mammaliicoccus lentus]